MRRLMELINANSAERAPWHRSMSQYLGVCEVCYAPVTLMVVIIWDVTSGHQISCSRKQLW